MKYDRPENIYYDSHPPGSDPNQITVKAKPGELGTDEWGFLGCVGFLIFLIIFA